MAKEVAKNIIISDPELKDCYYSGESEGIHRVRVNEKISFRIEEFAYILETEVEINNVLLFQQYIKER